MICQFIKSMHMNANTWSELLWGKNSKFAYLLIAAAVLLLTMLGGRELWTQENRWADTVLGMFYRHDFLHPYLGDVNYYDKPLLSYWLIAALSNFIGFTTWALRLPCAFAGILAIWSIYRIGVKLKDQRLGLLAGWLLLTTFYFVFWAKTSSADMLNLAGTLFAVCWYIEKKSQPSFINYTVFFLILAITSLCKGLVGAIVPMLVILPDLLMQKEWKKHLRWSFCLSIVPAAIVYLLPFWASAHFGNSGYGQNGLYLVYRENILRYFQPFDHKGPIYTYFIYLPIYLFPWALFFIPALFCIKSRWRNMSANSKWVIWACLLLFLFFTLSGSRRNYYILPVVPFAILLTADWISAGADVLAKRYVWAGRVVVIVFLLLFFLFDIAQPLHPLRGGFNAFSADLQREAGKTKPWPAWRFVMLDSDNKVRFYLRLPPEVKNYGVSGEREKQTKESLLQQWPILSTRSSDVIFISRKSYEPLLRNIFVGYRVVETPPGLGDRLLRIKNLNLPIAFVPPQETG